MRAPRASRSDDGASPLLQPLPRRAHGGASIVWTFVLHPCIIRVDGFLGVALRSWFIVNDNL